MGTELCVTRIRIATLATDFLAQSRRSREHSAENDQNADSQARQDDESNNESHRTSRKHAAPLDRKFSKAPSTTDQATAHTLATQAVYHSPRRHAVINPYADWNEGHDIRPSNLHLLDGLNSKKMQPQLEHSGGQVANSQS